jgi:hypothetical protein
MPGTYARVGPAMYLWYPTERVLTVCCRRQRQCWVATRMTTKGHCLKLVEYTMHTVYLAFLAQRGGQLSQGVELNLTRPQSPGLHDYDPKSVSGSF